MGQRRLQKLAPDGTQCPPGIYYDETKDHYVVDFVKSAYGTRLHIYEVGFLSILDAEDAKERMINERLETLEKEASKKITFGQFFDRFVEYRSHHVRGSSISQANTVFHKYFLSDKNRPASDVLSFINMDRIYGQILYDESLSSPWKNRMIGVLRNYASCAFKWKIISGENYQDLSSLLENIPEGNRKIEKQVWTEAEEQRFLAIIDDLRDKVMFALFLELGARLGEFLGLTWDVYDGKRGRVRICKQLLNGSQRTFVLSSTLKTKESYRECRLKKETKEMLNEYRKSLIDSHVPYMFTSSVDLNMPLSKAAFRALFEKYMKAAKVKRITPHCVRHMKATRLLKVCKNMLEVRAVAKFLGHSPTILMDVYSHSDDAVIDRVLKRLK